MSRRPPTPSRTSRARRAPPKGRKVAASTWSDPQAWARDPEGNGLAPTILAFPTRPNNARTMEDRENAILASYSGRLRDLVDLGRILISEDGFQQGLVDTMSHGLLGMPLAFQGDPDIVAALTDSQGTPGEYGAMHPENEGAKVFADGLVFNMGWGQYRFDDPTDLVRPIGYHRVPKLYWVDARWFRRDPYTLQWFFLGRGGEVPVTPGDGEWLLFQPYPDTDAWRHGPVLYMTLCAIFARDTLFDRQRVSEVCAPTRIARATKPTTPKARDKMASKIAQMAHDNQITLDHEWLYEIVSAAAGDWWKVCGEIITWARQMVEVGLTGNILSIEGPTGFSNADVYRRVTDSRRRFYANAWTRTIREQGLTWYVRDNWGEAAVARCPVPVYNVESPEDAIARAGALKAWGEGVKTLAEGVAAAGVEVEPASIIELLQRAGIRARVKGARSLGLAGEQLGAVLRGNVALASLGEQPFPAGDPRGDQTIAELIGAAKAPAGGAPSGAPAPSAPAPSVGAPATAAEPDVDEGPEQDDGAAARLADDMNTHGIAACRHRRTSACPTCGVKASYRVVPGEGGAPHSFKATWAAIAAQRAAA